MPDINLVLNLLGFALLIIGMLYAGPRIVKSKQQEQTLAEKDRIIETRRQDNEALRGHQQTLATDLEECRLSAARATAESAAWKARYEEQSKYTAKEALSTIEVLIGHSSEEAGRRHVEVMASLSNISALVGDRRRVGRRGADDPPLTSDQP